MFENLPQSAEEFKSQMLSECIQALKLNTFGDNFDNERYNTNGNDISGIFYPGERAFWFSWFTENSDKIFKAMQLLDDEGSKRLYLIVIAFRLAGHHSVRIPVDFSESDEIWKQYCELEKFEISKLELTGMFGKMRHYNFQFKGKHYVGDCLGFKYLLHRNQYFFDNGQVSISPSEGDHVIDGGACLGDTALVFGNAVGSNGKVYAFDPVYEHVQVLEHNAKLNPALNIKIFPCGLSDSDHMCDPIRVNTYSPGFRVAGNKVPLRAIDSLVIEKEIEKIDYIKLDVEGAELSSLKGAMGSIRLFKPKLGVSLYHKPNDIFEIPIFLNENFPDYQMYINHYTIHNEETVLYCTSPNH